MNHHPQPDVMLEYAQGNILSPLSVMVAAHLEVCKECRDQYTKTLEKLTKPDAEVFQVPSDEMNSALNNIFNMIDQGVEEIKPAKELSPFEITVAGQVIPLPRSMSFLKDQVIPWKEFGKQNAIAPVISQENGRFYLIYMGPGETVPHHDHNGREFSYVVAGTYNDGISNFSSGDFSVFKKGDQHTPHATSDDGCLVVSWVEGRLNFFTGIFKPLNRILWWYLHKA
ncbi:MAG: cupin domain-containing protein [Bacteriovoracaceae bacterium]